MFSSAKLQISVFSTNIKRSFRNTLNNNGPKIDPCGTPLLMSDHTLSCEKSGRIRSYSGPYFPVIGLSPNVGKYGPE